MNAPHIGEPTSPDRLKRLLCGFGSTLPEQEWLACDQRAELHVLAGHPEDGSLHNLLTCMVHYPAAAEAGEKIVSHEIGLWCGLPSTRFDSDENVVRGRRQRHRTPRWRAGHQR